MTALLVIAMLVLICGTPAMMRRLLNLTLIAFVAGVFFVAIGFVYFFNLPTPEQERRMHPQTESTSPTVLGLLPRN